MQWAESTFAPLYSQLNGIKAEQSFLLSKALATGVLHIALVYLGAFIIQSRAGVPELPVTYLLTSLSTVYYRAFPIFCFRPSVIVKISGTGHIEDIDVFLLKTARESYQSRLSKILQSFRRWIYEESAKPCVRGSNIFDAGNQKDPTSTLTPPSPPARCFW